MNGRGSQSKGAEGERELCDVLRQAGYHVRRGGSLTYGSVPDLIGLPGIHIECKRQEALNLLAAIRQAEADAERFQDGLPAVFHRRNRSPWLVTMLLDDWLSFYQKTPLVNEKAGEKSPALLLVPDLDEQLPDKRKDLL